MSCPSELTWSIYVDGELEDEELRSSELHLVSCRECRTRVVALQEEGQALTHAMLERETRRAAAPVVAPPARDLAWGLPLAIASVTVLLTIVGALIELRLPGVLDLLNPRRLMGAYELAFDSVFMVRDQLPGFLELVTAVGVVAAVSAIGCALVHALSQRLLNSSSLMIVFAVALMAPEVARAIELRIDQDTIIGASETVDGSLFCVGDVVTIDGTIDGDLVAGAERVSVRGKITGNLFVFGEEVEIDGEVEGTVITFARTTRLAAKVAGSALLGGERLTVAEGAEIGRDATFLGEGVQLDGVAKRDVTFGGEWLELRGEIGRDLHALEAERITLLDSAKIGRDVHGHLHDGPEAVDRAPGAEVGGQVEITHESLVKEHVMSRYRDPGFYLGALMFAAAGYVFGLLVYLLDPRLFDADPPNARGFFRAMGIGFMIILAGPVAMLLVGLTVVGLPIALFGFFLFLLALYTGGIVVAAMIGRAVMPPKAPGLGGFAPSYLVGTLILTVAAIIPFVGVAVRVIMVLFGVGCLFERVRGVHELNLRGLRSTG